MSEDELAKIPPLREEEEIAFGELDRGKAEALSLGRGLSARDLKKEAEESDHDRNERFKEHFDKIGIAALYVVSFALLIAGGVWF